MPKWVYGIVTLLYLLEIVVSHIHITFRHYGTQSLFVIVGIGNAGRGAAAPNENLGKYVFSSCVSFARANKKK